MSKSRIIYRGEVYYADLSPSFGSEQGGLRPVVIIQNNMGNKHAPTTIVVPITSRLSKHKIPTHVDLLDGEGGMRSTDCIVLCEQIRTIDKERLRGYMGVLTAPTMEKVEQAMRISLGLN